MAFPTSPSDGQIYNDYKYNTSAGAWLLYTSLSIPNTYDLTSTNITHTLPAITGDIQTKSIYWENGGTYKLSIKRDDGTYLDYEGEGDGHILIESDGSNWQVREYEDNGKISGKEEYWFKNNNKLTCTYTDINVTGTQTSKSIQGLTVYEIVTSWTYPKPFKVNAKPGISYSIDYSSASNLETGIVWGVNNTACNYGIDSLVSMTSFTSISLTATGPWK